MGERRRDALYDYSSPGTSPFEAARPETYVGRPLFAYRSYEHPKLGLIYRLFTGSEQAGSAEPSRQFIVTT